LPAFDVPVVDTTGAGDAFTAGFVHKAIQMSGEFQDEMVDYGTGKDMPRGHLHTRERLREAFKDKTIAGECGAYCPWSHYHTWPRACQGAAGSRGARGVGAVLYASAVGAMTCMEEGAVAAQPPERLVNKFVQVYGDKIVITEEKRKTEVPKFKPLGWQFSR
jgi:sugar/nucleoside kinase (ribokinase family)